LLSAVDESRNLPKYERLCVQLVQDVVSGRLKPGDLLPPEPLFAEQLQLARSTVRQALSQMERNGLIRRVRGKGTFIHEDAPARLKGGLDVFALIVPDAQSGYYPSLMTGFEQSSDESRNQVITISTRNDPYRQADAILQLIDKRVSGVAIVPVTTPSTPAYHVRQLQKNGIPVVLCHRAVEGIRAPILAFRGRDIGRLAGEALVRRGHRRVAFISAMRTELSEQYEAGLRSAMQAVGATLDPRHVVYLGNDGYVDLERYEQLMDASLGKLLDMPAGERPTAIFTGFDQTAELIFLQLMRRGVLVPVDISLISFGGATRLGPMQHRLTAVTVDENAIGRLAADLLAQMRTGRRSIESDERIEIELGFHTGQTLGQPPVDQ
jgi:DNA-binding LacI/PurR family transcriptional regulator